MGRAKLVQCWSLRHFPPGSWAVWLLGLLDSKPNPPSHPQTIHWTLGTEGSSIPLTSHVDPRWLMPWKDAGLWIPQGFSQVLGISLSSTSVTVWSTGEISQTPQHASGMGKLPGWETLRAAYFSSVFFVSACTLWSWRHLRLTPQFAFERTHTKSHFPHQHHRSEGEKCFTEIQWSLYACSCCICTHSESKSKAKGGLCQH